MDFLRESGVAGVVVAGGEPTPRPTLEHAVNGLSSRGMWVALQTNATRPRRLTDLVSRLDRIALPLDVSEIDSIGEAVRSLAPEVWKVYEFRSRGVGQINAASLELPSADFLQVAEEAQQTFSDLHVAVSPAEASANAYLIIIPDSNLVIPQKDFYLSLDRRDGRPRLIQGGAQSETIPRRDARATPCRR
jgi:organic radical activating enzyme